jgi:hypothetical protein
MPQFVLNGPILPDRLVQALEDDRVVIFCGAGISMGAGLPSYRGLVEHCYTELTEPLPKNTDSDWHWPDRMLGALENRYSPTRVRALVTERLTRRPRTLAVHRAILRLARLRKHDGIRLVTTNFDTLFEKAAKSLRIRYRWYAGPILPIPRSDRGVTWRSPVYLHGRLGEGPEHQLVLTSADFGRAYLTDTWAARFVSRLFSDFTILFIGYSLNDPVLRYMTDAFAADNADRHIGEQRGPAYIFTPYGDEQPPDPRPFQDRNLEPIFYSPTNNHAALRQTLLAWADARDDYLASVGQLINDIAPRQPNAISPTDTANLLWAVLGRPGDDGYGARTFSAVPDLPPVAWFDIFESYEAERQADHERARSKAHAEGRPPPPPLELDFGPLFPPFLDGRELRLTASGYALIPWIVRHLGSDGMLKRVLTKLENHRRPHPQIRREIRRRLNEEHALSEGYVRFWRLVCAEGEWARAGQQHIIGPAQVVREAVSDNSEASWLVQETLAALQPRLQLSASSFHSDTGEDDRAPVAGERLSDFALAQVVLSGRDRVRSMVEAIDARGGGDAFWANLIDDLTSSLSQAIQIFSAADEANEISDPSAFHRPSIAPHPQNYAHRQWTLLFDLIWHGWTYIDARDAARSRAVVLRWRSQPWLAFRRLVMAAMAASAHFSDDERLEVLLNA